MKSRGAEFDALLTPMERLIRMARYWGERAQRVPLLGMDREAMRECMNEARRFVDSRPRIGEPADAAERGSNFERTTAMYFHAYQIALNWFRCGLPKVSIGSKHAAALMCTRMPSDAAPELRMPWSTFVIDVPDGIGVQFSGLPVRHVVVHRDTTGDFTGFNDEDGDVRVFCMVASPERGLFDVPFVVSAVADLRELADRARKNEESGNDRSVSELSRAYSKMVAAILWLALGVVAELNQPREAATIERNGSKPRLNRRGEPIVTTFALARDINVDCRAAVREYVSGARGTSPTVQSLVRGHWKKQPCGAARSDRKLIFVEPYWRGPETAPIALRAHVVGQEKEVGRE